MRLDEGTIFFDVQAYDGRFRINYNGTLNDILTILSTGKVGIGTASPGAKLDIVGVTRITTDDNPPTSDAGVEIHWVDSESPEHGILQAYDRSETTHRELKIWGKPITMGPSSAALTIDTNGKVGIGTATPNALLELYSNSANVIQRIRFPNGQYVGHIEFYDGDNCKGIIQYVSDGYDSLPTRKESLELITYSDGFISFRPNDAEKMRIDKDGNVGIGTTSPGEKLEVNGNMKISSGAWNSGHLILGSYHLWVDSTGDLRIKSSAPTSDTDGTVVGTQS